MCLCVCAPQTQTTEANWNWVVCGVRLAMIFASRLSWRNPAPLYSSKNTSHLKRFRCCLCCHHSAHISVRAMQLQQHNFLSIVLVAVVVVVIACHSPIPLNSFIIYSSLRFSRIINENGIRNANNNIDDGGMFEISARRTLFDVTMLNVLCYLADFTPPTKSTAKCFPAQLIDCILSLQWIINVVNISIECV